MRGLLIRQPWAGLFASGLKINAAGETLEFRNRLTNIREQVAIQAGTSLTHRVPLWDGMTVPEYGVGSEGSLHVIRGRRFIEVARNCTDEAICLAHREHEVLCLATLSDCRPVETTDVTCPGCPDPTSEEWMHTWAWVFTDLIALPEPLACKPKRGAQIWFEVPPKVEAEVLRQAREGEGRER